MNIKRAVFMAVLVVAIAALAFPLASLRAKAGGFAGDGKSSVAAVKASAAAVGVTSPKVAEVERENATAGVQDTAATGKISAETLNALGIKRLAKGVSGKDVRRAVSKKIGQGNPDLQVMSALPPGGKITPPGGRKPSGGQGPPLVGQPLVLNEFSALSDALIFTEGGRDTQFSEVALISDWDGREDCAADRGAKIDDFSFAESEPDVTLTRAAISEHTIANGHLFNSYYYGDSVGNLWFGFDLFGNSLVDFLIQANIPAIINSGATGFGGFRITDDTRVAGDCTDDQVTVTGIAVQPVADLADFTSTGLENVISPPLGSEGCGVIGEVIYVSIFDSEGCASNGANQPIRSRILAFAVWEDPAALGAEFVSGNVRQVMRSKFSNEAGVAVDDDGSLYYQLLDLIQFTGGGIFKATEIAHVGCGAPRINRVVRSIPDPPTLGSWVGTTANPINTSNGVRNTNYGRGSSPLYGDIVAINTGPCNVLYAAVSPSFGGTPGDPSTQGLFPAPSAFPSGTPSMIISFADCGGGGATDACTAFANIGFDPQIPATLPAADGFADVAAPGAAAPGVNTYRVFALGNGPDIRPAPGGTAIVPGTLSSVLKLDSSAGMQIDYAINAGIAVSGEGTVFVISGGEPAGVGKSPSPMVAEILCFEDACPSDRRGDFVDLRKDTLPNPPASGGNVGDGDSDRFDHIFFQAPIDQVTLTPTGLSGLNLGFLRYTNRLAPFGIGAGVLLGTTFRVLGDDATTDTDPNGPCGDPSGAILFEALDPGHQVAGGDDQNVPHRGDDDDGAGNPVLSGPFEGGFEFLFGGPVGTGDSETCGCVWNGFFWNSNGNISFGNGDTDNTPSVPEFRAGVAKIAPAWADLNPSARAQCPTSFPVQALGFVNVNAFKIRWINVPRFGQECCTGSIFTGASTIGGSPTTAPSGNASNTFAVTLYDDGTGIDENACQALDAANPTGFNGPCAPSTAGAFDQREGPTDLRFTKVNFTNPVGGSFLVGCSPRREGSGIFVFEYCRMDLLGTPEFKVLTGYSIGGQDPLNAPPDHPGLCEVNLSVAAAAADAGAFGVLAGGQIAAVGCNCCIGEGTEPTIFELFNEGSEASIGSGGEVTLAKPDFDLRFEGNNAAACTSGRQRDNNRGKVCFLGVGCEPPSNPSCITVVPGTFVTTPTPGGPTVGLVNAICQVPLNLVGCGFYPNEITTICQGFQAETGIPLERPGKTVMTIAELHCDTNGDGFVDAFIPLDPVTPVSCNLITATIPVLASMPGTGFPSACCGGDGTIVVTTEFSEGDNNVFGDFAQMFTCTLPLGLRAPVVFSVTPSNGTCNGLQDLLISGACFCYTNTVDDVKTTFGVTSVIFRELGGTATITVGVNPSASGQVKDLGCNPNLIDVLVNITSANAGKTFLVYVVNAQGESRNLTGPVLGQPGAPCPTTGNEQGFQVTFKCNSSGGGGTGNTPVIATVETCHLDRQDTGQFFLDVTGTNIKPGATVTVGGVTPKKIKVIAVEPGTSNPTTLRLVKKVCNGLPGNIIITNTVPGGQPSQPKLCTEKCPTS